MAYTTESGEHWDEIAKKVYGTERAVSFLMANNGRHLGTFRFKGGETLNTPEEPRQQSGSTPPWR